MTKNIKISSLQLSYLMIGFMLGSSVISYPAKGAFQDAWIAHLIGWFGGFILVTLYILIYGMNKGKTWIEILKSSFGRYLGSIIGILYIWYFIHIASLVIRSFAEYMVIVNYEKTPIIVIIISIFILLYYALKKGLEVIGRSYQLVLPILFLTYIIIVTLSIPKFDFNNLFPTLEHGWKVIFKTSFVILTFPFGETVMFLMIFKNLNDDTKLFKTSYVALMTAGLMLLGGVLLNLLVLGQEVILRHIFATLSTVSLVPIGVLEPLISVSLLISTGMKILICTYSATYGVAEIFGFEDYRIFIAPIILIIVPLSIWIHKNYSAMFLWGGDISPYYSLPFQVIFPMTVLIISFIKQKLLKRSKSK